MTAVFFAAMPAARSIPLTAKAVAECFYYQLKKNFFTAKPVLKSRILQTAAFYSAKVFASVLTVRLCAESFRSMQESTKKQKEFH